MTSRSIARARHGTARLGGRFAAISLLAVVLVATGCGDRNLVIKVDVLSYMDPSQTNFEFGPIPALPGGVATGEQNVVPATDVNLFGNLADVAEVRAVSMRVVMVSESYSGSGSDTMRVYVSDPSSDPRTTSPVLAQPVVFTPSMAETVVTEINGDARVLDLFAAKQLRLAITTSVRGPDSGAALSGHVQITGLDAVVVCGHKGR